jgi:hypothetical protein
VAASLLVWLAGKYSPPIQVTALRVMAPLITALLITGAFIAYYDWSVTGNPLLLPHSLNLKTYYSTPLFIWEKLRPPMHYNNRQFDDFYNGWVRDNFHGSVRDILRVSWEKVRAYPSAFLWSGALPALLASPLVLRDRKIRLLVVELAVCGVGLFLVVYSMPHYAAALTCVIYALLVQAVRHLRTVRWKGHPTGIALSRVSVTLLITVTAFNLYHVVRYPNDPYAWSWDKSRGSDARQRIEAFLAGEPGRQLVMVRYASTHNPHGEWVYNSADIDAQQIIWARELGTEQDEKLLAYFKGRKVWLFDPDRDWKHVRPYTPLEPPPQ